MGRVIAHVNRNISDNFNTNTIDIIFKLLPLLIKLILNKYPEINIIREQTAIFF